MHYKKKSGSASSAITSETFLKMLISIFILPFATHQSEESSQYFHTANYSKAMPCLQRCFQFVKKCKHISSYKVRKTVPLTVIFAVLQATYRLDPMHMHVCWLKSNCTKHLI